MTEPDSSARPGTDQDLVDQVRDIFVEVLDLEEEVVGDSDFFEIGGNSLMAALVVAHIRRNFGAPVNVRTILRARTPAGIARAIAELRTGSAL